MEIRRVRQALDPAVEQRCAISVALLRGVQIREAGVGRYERVVQAQCGLIGGLGGGQVPLLVEQHREVRVSGG